MILRIITRTRPTPDIGWWRLKNNYIDRKIVKFRGDGKILNHSLTTTEDGLRIIAVSLWNSRSFIEEFENDPLVRSIRQRRSLYENQTGITVKLFETDLHESLE